MQFLKGLLPVVSSASPNVTGVLLRKIAAFTVTVAEVLFGQSEQAASCFLVCDERSWTACDQAFLSCEVKAPTPGV